MPERQYPEMEGMSEDDRQRYLRALERAERRTLQATSPILLALYEAANAKDRHRLVSALEVLLFWLGPLLEAYLPEARGNLAEDMQREAEPPLGMPGEVVQARLGLGVLLPNGGLGPVMPEQLA
jgi:hypothetical protein